MNALKEGHIDNRAWGNGFNAGEQGKSIVHCPHRKGSIQANSWYQGHASAIAKKEKPKD